MHGCVAHHSNASLFNPAVSPMRPSGARPSFFTSTAYDDALSKLRRSRCCSGRGGPLRGTPPASFPDQTGPGRTGFRAACHSSGAKIRARAG